MDPILVIFYCFPYRILLLKCNTPILESLTGLSTIRAYQVQVGRFMIFLIFCFQKAQDRCIKDAEHGLDMENRAYLMTISLQRWLALRLDLFGSILVLGIGLFAAGLRTSVNPAKIGVVLSYMLSSKFIRSFYCLSTHLFLFSK